MNDKPLVQTCYSPPILNDAFHPHLSADSHTKTTPILIPSVDTIIVQNTPDANHIDISNSNSASISSSPVKHRDSSGSDTRPTDLGHEPDLQSEEEEFGTPLLSVEPSEVVTEAEADVFTSFNPDLDDWDAADNDWLYVLQTECSKPGAVCECGPSCCCPGCFTHTNNPGDRDVYIKVMSKMGGMLEPEKEERLPETNE